MALPSLFGDHRHRTFNSQIHIAFTTDDDKTALKITPTPVGAVCGHLFHRSHTQRPWHPERPRERFRTACSQAPTERGDTRARSPSREGCVPPALGRRAGTLALRVGHSEAGKLGSPLAFGSDPSAPIFAPKGGITPNLHLVHQLTFPWRILRRKPSPPPLSKPPFLGK